MENPRGRVDSHNHEVYLFTLSRHMGSVRAHTAPRDGGRAHTALGASVKSAAVTAWINCRVATVATLHSKLLPYDGDSLAGLF